MVAVPKHLAVVGGAGEVGQLMLELLAHATDCHTVRVIDARPPSPQPMGSRQSGDSHCNGNGNGNGNGKVKGPEVEFKKHRLGTDCQESLVAALEGIECVLCMVTPALQRATAEEFYRTNVMGVKSLLAACETAGVRQFAFLSSIAVTSHVHNSINATEDDPLPAMAMYTSPYDRSKRVGEDAVLAADREGGLRTCALRAGGLLTTHRGHMYANACSVPGFVYCPADVCAIDFMDGFDICRALLLAAQALAERPAEAGGQAFFVTKGEALNLKDLCGQMADSLGWRLVLIPMWLHRFACSASLVAYRVQKAMGLRVPGVPLHVIMSYANFEQTFDNSKAQRVLRFKSEDSTKESVTRLASEYRCTPGIIQLSPGIASFFVGAMGLSIGSLLLAGFACTRPTGLLQRKS